MYWVAGRFLITPSKSASCQKLIKLTDRNKDGWLVVQEYESDEVASNSEDEKKIRKTKLSAEKKRKESKANPSNASKRFKSVSDNQFFRGKIFYCVSL